MLVIPGRRCQTCEGPTRRELLRAGSIGMLGLNLANFLEWQKTARAAAKYEGARGFGSAKSVIMVFLQGGPSHIDLWDPKPDAPSNIRGEFKGIPTKIPGTHIGEHMPMMANALDKATLIRSMSYTPNGLFNHTAAIYQMLTGYPPDRVSPSGQLEPPNGADFPTAGSHVSKLKPPKEAVLPFVELPRPLQESGVIGKGGAAGFLGNAYDPYRLYQDPAKPIKTEDLALQRCAARAPEGPLRIAEGHQRFHAGPGEGAEELCHRRILRQGIRAGALGQGARRVRPDEGGGQDARALRDHDVRTGAAAVAAADRSGDALRADELAVSRERQSGSGFLGHARRQFRAAQEPALPQTRPRAFGAAGGHERPRHAEGDAGGGDRRIRTFAAHWREHVRQLKCARRPRPLAVLLQRGGGWLRDGARRAVRRKRPDRQFAQRQADAPERSAV